MPPTRGSGLGQRPLVVQGQPGMEPAVRAMGSLEVRGRDLGRRRLADPELDRLEGQLNHILDQYAKLSELDTSAIPPTAQTIELENILREDVVTPSLAVEEALRNAPLAAGGYIVSPPLLGEDSGR